MEEYLKEIDIIVGLIVVAFGALVAGLRHLDQRTRQAAEAKFSEVTSGQRETHERLSHVERRIGDLEGDHSKVRSELSEMKVAMARLATKDDVAELAQRSARQEATLHAMGEKFDTLYRAALAPRASQ